MTLRRVITPAMVLCGLLGCAGLAPAAETNLVQFSQPAPYSSDEEIARRFGYRPPLPKYELAQEKFRLLVPEGYSTNRSWGLLVWISPGDDAYLPVEWEQELAKQNVILVAPYRSGNDRHPVDRLRQALDATCNVCRKYRIDRRRIYVGGFSGGARMASMLGIACADIFTGAICVCGVNFHLHVPSGDGKFYPGTFFPTPEILQYARVNERFVFMTGDNDPGHDNITAVVGKGFKRDSFKHVLLIDSPAIEHAIPEASRLAEALVFLGGKGASGSPEKR